jgi:hypothetical protein
MSSNFLANMYSSQLKPLEGPEPPSPINYEETDPTIANILDSIGEINTNMLTYLNKSGGSMTGILNMQNSKITNVATPTVSTDCVNKNYTDTMPMYLHVDGTNGMEGLLNMNNNYITNVGTPITNNGAVPKIYVDTISTNIYSTIVNVQNETSDLYRLKTNVDFNDNLDLNSYLINNLGNPIDASDATTKVYVDTEISSSRTATISSVLELTDDLYLSQTGGILSGSINMQDNLISNIASPVNNNDATNKTYVTQQLSSLKSSLTEEFNTSLTLYVLKSSPEMSGDLDMNSKNITNLNSPTSDNHAATKKYADDFVATNVENLYNTIQSEFAPLENCIFTTTMSMSDYSIINVGTPVSNTDATNKLYVDAQIVSNISSLETKYAPLSGCVFSTNVSLGNNKLTSVTDPTTASDGATKNYVDTTCVLKTGSTITGAINITNSATSTSSTTGALKILGGVGINENLNVAGNIVGTRAIFGTFEDQTSSILTLNSSTKGLLLTRTIQTSITTPIQGLIYYDTNQNETKIYDGSKWKNVGYNQYQIINIPFTEMNVLTPGTTPTLGKISSELGINLTNKSINAGGLMSLVLTPTISNSGSVHNFAVFNIGVLENGYYKMELSFGCQTNTSQVTIACDYGTGTFSDISNSYETFVSDGSSTDHSTFFINNYFEITTSPSSSVMLKCYYSGKNASSSSPYYIIICGSLLVTRLR